eukprot:TRINITY_DN2958_c0_g1_i2.p1 TRINITY_DN2958_c0_g1~~TRINITY_DN2958_c0_g1_i2.p1  ORF type:complete len:251 (+),score=27.68 TRINITY_DN2958_c0_g1_i2:15-767(+)
MATEVVRLKWLKTAICASVIMISKIGMLFAKEVKIYNHENWVKYVLDRKLKTPVITIQNHISVIDDPVIWGVLFPFKRIWKWDNIRYSFGAQEIMFTNPFFWWFFGSAGKVLPTVRGAGVQQYAMRKAVQHLKEGWWVNIFPEGKVNQTGTLFTFRWGVGKLVADTKPTPCVLPVYHTGFDKVLPEGHIYIPRLFPRKSLTVYVGKPIFFDDLIAKNAKENRGPTSLYVDVTNRCYQEMLAIENTVKALK